MKNLIKVIEEKGNPFKDEFPELIALDTRKVFDSSVSESVRKILEIGRNQYTEYFKNVFEDRISTIDQPIKKNMLPLPRNPRVKVKTSQSQKIMDHKNMSALFGQLYLAQRESDSDELFCHELISLISTITLRSPYAKFTKNFFENLDFRHWGCFRSSLGSASGLPHFIHKDSG